MILKFKLNTREIKILIQMKARKYKNLFKNRPMYEEEKKTM